MSLRKYRNKKIGILDKIFFMIQLAALLFVLALTYKGIQKFGFWNYFLYQNKVIIMEKEG